jgi:replicative DNA helicase
MNHEIALINSIIQTGDLQQCIEDNVGNVFSEYEDVWNFIIKFHSEYGQVPSKDVVKSNFKSFEYFSTESPLQYYIDEAKKGSLNRGVRTTLFKASELLKDGSDPAKVIAMLQNSATELMRDSGRLSDTNIVDYKERADILLDRINNPQKTTLGVPTGLSVIDAHFGGSQPGDFIVVMGWTGVGKSSITRLVAANAWRQGYVPLIISLEMDRIQEEFRMDTILNAGDHFTNTQLTNGSGLDFDKYESWAENTFRGKHPIHLVTSDGIEAADQHFVQAKIEQYKPDLVILDYHTLFDDARGGGTETERAKNLSKDFKRIAVRNRVPIWDVSGVTMEGGHEDRPPNLNEIAWSKQLAYDADMILAIHRKRDDNVFQCVTRKTRRCQPFAFYIEWNLDTGKWKELFDYEAF